MKGKKKANPMPNLETQATDALAAASRMVLGAVPVIGSALAEMATTIIPRQRMERVIDFAQKLYEKTKKLEASFIAAQLSDENFLDILEEGMSQAAKSVAEKRREYIASVIDNGLSEDQVEFMETRRMLKLLSELNDNEIVLLRYYLVPTQGGDEEFREKHNNIIRVEQAVINSPQHVIDKQALHDSYIENLCTLGLLEKEHKVDITGKVVYGHSTKQPEVSMIKISNLGRFFLRQIGLS